MKILDEEEDGELEEVEDRRENKVMAPSTLLSKLTRKNIGGVDGGTKEGCKLEYQEGEGEGVEGGVIDTDGKKQSSILVARKGPQIWW